jgi:uncharacterized damage-inducible protein DinB
MQNFSHHPILEFAFFNLQFEILRTMQDDYVSLFTFNRWANTRMLDACRKLSFEQYTAEPFPGWSSVRFTVWHIALVTDVWGHMLADDPDRSFPTEAEVPTVDEAVHLLERASRTFDSIVPKLTPEQLTTPRTFIGSGWTVIIPPWAVLRHVVNHTTYHRGQVASKLKRFGIQQPETDVVFCFGQVTLNQ